MKITVTATSQTLDSILTNAQKDSIYSSANSSTGESDLLIRNSGTETIYAEFGEDATVANGFPIDAGDILNFKDNNVGELRLIAGAENDNVRILGN